MAALRIRPATLSFSAVLNCLTRCRPGLPPRPPLSQLTPRHLLPPSRDAKHHAVPRELVRGLSVRVKVQADTLLGTISFQTLIFLVFCPCAFSDIQPAFRPGFSNTAATCVVTFFFQLPTGLPGSNPMIATSTTWRLYILLVGGRSRLQRIYSGRSACSRPGTIMRAEIGGWFFETEI